MSNILDELRASRTNVDANLDVLDAQYLRLTEERGIAAPLERNT